MSVLNSDMVECCAPCLSAHNETRSLLQPGTAQSAAFQYKHDLLIFFPVRNLSHPCNRLQARPSKPIHCATAIDVSLRVEAHGRDSRDNTRFRMSLCSTFKHTLSNAIQGLLDLDFRDDIASQLTTPRLSSVIPR